MTGQEARDDEREAVIAEAEDLIAYHLREQEFDPRYRSRTPAEQAELIGRLVSAIRKHPEPEPARDDEREALIDRMRRASTAIYVATEAVVADDISAMLREAADLLDRKHPEPGAPAQVALSVQSRRSGKTQRMIDALLAQANERGIAVEIIEAKHPEPEITDAAVEQRAKDMASASGWWWPTLGETGRLGRDGWRERARAELVRGGQA